MRVAAIFSLELMIAVLTFTSQQKERLIVQLYVIISLACVVGIFFFKILNSIHLLDFPLRKHGTIVNPLNSQDLIVNSPL